MLSLKKFGASLTRIYVNLQKNEKSKIVSNSIDIVLKNLEIFILKEFFAKLV